MDVSQHVSHQGTVDLDDALRRARADFQEMPGLHLTPDQARRLWMLDGRTCATVLSTLVASGFLSRSKTGAFIARERNPVSPSSLRRGVTDWPYRVGPARL